MTNPSDRKWANQAACNDYPTDLWFPVALRDENDKPLPVYEAGDNHGREAKAICRVCPVRSECLTAAVTNNEQEGIFGGAGENTLRKLRRAWIVDGLWAGPVWRLAHDRHFQKLDRERVSVDDANGPGATHGNAVTYSRGCRCDACCWAARRRACRLRRDRRQQVAA